MVVYITPADSGSRKIPGIKLGIQPDVTQTPKEAFEFASVSGFNHIELLLDHPYYSLDFLSYAEILELKGSYDLEVLIHAPANSTNFISTSSVMRKASYSELERTMEFADRCEAKLVTVHIGWNPGFITARGFVFQPEIYEEHNYRVLTREFYTFAKHYGEILSIENTVSMDAGVGKALEFLLENTEISLTFDAGHNNISKNEIFLNNFDRVKNVHLHDNDGRRDSHSTLGSGNVDFSFLKNYRGYATLEVRDIRAIFDSRKWLCEFLGFQV